MKRILLAIFGLSLAPIAAAATLAESNAELIGELQSAHRLTDAQVRAVSAIFKRSGFLGQGNPAITRHPISRSECRAQRAARGQDGPERGFERVCGAPYMAPLYDPLVATMADARQCIDQFEFPNIPCAYPAVWVRAREAAELCSAIGKRLCDAHEWEGACAGRLLAPDYRFDLAHGIAAPIAIERMAAAHNRAHAGEKLWSYGPTYRRGVCATGSRKSPGCNGGGWAQCGSNTYPSGSFPDCRSTLGVYDLHGNVAEHMNLPLAPAQMASRTDGGGLETLGHTEMKGSWFVFDTTRAHEDWCRWRAPYWHGSRVNDLRSHANYHLGFRCCKSASVR